MIIHFLEETNTVLLKSYNTSWHWAATVNTKLAGHATAS